MMECILTMVHMYVQYDGSDSTPDRAGRTFGSPRPARHRSAPGRQRLLRMRPGCLKELPNLGGCKRATGGVVPAGVGR